MPSYSFAYLFKAKAQTDINTTFSDRMNYIFQLLEKNRVPDGLLLDYAMEFTNLSNFNGTGVKKIINKGGNGNYITLGAVY